MIIYAFALQDKQVKLLKGILPGYVLTLKWPTKSVTIVPVLCSFMSKHEVMHSVPSKMSVSKTLKA